MSSDSAPFRQRGIIAAALTPWVPDSRGADVDFVAFDRQLDWLAAQAPLAVGVAGVEVQEYHVLDDAARVGLVARAVERLGGIPVVAGISSPTPSRSAALASSMADVGASAVLALAGPKPWAAGPTADEFVDWFSELAELTTLPIIVYSNPRTGSEPSVAALATLAARGYIAGIKETSRDMMKILGLCDKLAGPDLAGVYNNMETLLATLVLGGHGAMVPAPALPMSQRIVDAYETGDLNEARKWQRFFVDFPSTWQALGLGPAVKAAMRILGVDVGDTLSPYRDIDAAQRAAMEAHLRAWGLLG